MQQAAFLAMIGAILEVVLAAVGAVVHGVTGLALGILLASVMECALFSPVVFGVVRMHRATGGVVR
jgi:hypothetical protein